MQSLFARALHKHTAPDDLRNLLNREWATISVVAGLVVLLEGTSSTSNTFASVNVSPPFLAVHFVFLAMNTLAYLCAITSCAVALILLHVSTVVCAAFT
jgi:hypothetical protein